CIYKEFTNAFRLYALPFLRSLSIKVDTKVSLKVFTNCFTKLTSLSLSAREITCQSSGSFLFYFSLNDSFWNFLLFWLIHINIYYLVSNTMYDHLINLKKLEVSNISGKNYFSFTFFEYNIESQLKNLYIYKLGHFGEHNIFDSLKYFNIIKRLN